MSKPNKELHLFMPIGDDEIQVESWDKKLNKEVLRLHKEKPDAVVILYDDDAPAFLRAAVKMTNISISFHKTKKNELTEAQKKARSENGKRALVNNNLRNQKAGDKS